MTLYLEDDRENMLELLSRETGISNNVIVYSQVPLMTTRVPLPRVRPESPLVSNRDEHYVIRRQKEITTLAAETDFSLFGQLQQLRNSRGCNFTLDLSHLSAFSPQGKTLLNAYAADQKLPGTSPFNFEHGLE